MVLGVNRNTWSLETTYIDIDLKLGVGFRGSHGSAITGTCFFYIVSLNFPGISRPADSSSLYNTNGVFTKEKKQTQSKMAMYPMRDRESVLTYELHRRGVWRLSLWSVDISGGLKVHKHRVLL